MGASFGFQYLKEPLPISRHETFASKVNIRPTENASRRFTKNYVELLVPP